AGGVRGDRARGARGEAQFGEVRGGELEGVTLGVGVGPGGPGTEGQGGDRGDGQAEHRTAGHSRKHGWVLASGGWLDIRWSGPPSSVPVAAAIRSAAAR